MVDSPVVTVHGEASREVPPEIARFAVTVQARDKDRQAALARLAERAAAVRVLIEEYADAVERRETGALQVRPELKRSGERVVAYNGRVTTTVTVTDFTVLGELMLRLADQDQVEISGPWWSLRPESRAAVEVRQAAVRDAIERGREYAGALGARVTALLELADEGGADQPLMMARAGFSMGEAPELELDPQPQTVRAGVRARFAISEPDLG
ncbi:SIMPL domain-containing protein [Micromonosporaceae bacterium DT55]|uniref:SIMPL domain-containing protein n=1 Tax=Melissospora conviva TaxID=3388432 RepID=UPI003C190DE0